MLKRHWFVGCYVDWLVNWFGNLWFACWFVTRITQKLHNRFPRNLDGGRLLSSVTCFDIITYRSWSSRSLIVHHSWRQYLPDTKHKTDIRLNPITIAPFIFFLNVFGLLCPGCVCFLNLLEAYHRWIVEVDLPIGAGCFYPKHHQCLHLQHWWPKRELNPWVLFFFNILTWPCSIGLNFRTLILAGFCFCSMRSHHSSKRVSLCVVLDEAPLQLDAGRLCV